MIALGSYLVAFGAKYEEYTLFMLGTSTVATLFMIIIYVGLFPDKSEVWLVFLTLLFSLGVGSAAGWATMKYAKYGIIIGGAWLGGIVGSVAYSLVLRKISEKYPMLVLWLSILVMAALVAYLAHRFFGVAMIFGTAIIGSFLFFRVILAFKLYRVLLNSRVATRMSSFSTSDCRTRKARSLIVFTSTWLGWLYSRCSPYTSSGLHRQWVRKMPCWRWSRWGGPGWGRRRPDTRGPAEPVREGPARMRKPKIIELSLF